MGGNTIHSSHEEKRVRELLRYNILDTPDEKEFDDLTKVAAYLCDVKNAHIHFLDHDRQWTKSCHGWGVREMPREESICHHTIQQEKYLVVNDLRKDPRFKNLDYVKDKTIQFYGGVVLTSNEYNLGTLCVFGEEPKQLTDQQLESLQILGNEVEDRLELRLKREQLIEEHKKLKQSAIFLQNSTDIRLIIDPDTLKIEEVNEEAEELLGFRPEEIQGTPLTDYLRQDEFETELKRWAENNSEQQFSSETIIKTREGDTLWFRIIITEESDKYYVTGRNISRRKRSERRFIKQAKLTENIIQHLPGIFFLIDKKGKIKKWNNNLIEVANRTLEETKNRSYTNFIAAKDHDKAEKALHKVFTNGYARTELDFVSKDGKITPILLVGFRYRVDEDTYVTGIGIDISDEKQAIEELERKEQKLKEAQHIGKMGSWTWHIPTNKLHWSDEVFELYDLDKDKFEPTFENFMKMLPSSEQKKVKKIVDQILNGENWEEVELKVEKPDGSMVYIHERGEVYYDNEGKPVEVTGTMQDVTERRKNEEKLKSALKEKEVLLAEIHHRVKNNLAVVSGMMQLQAFEEKNENLKQKLNSSIGRINTMGSIHELLYQSENFSRLEVDKNIKKLVTDIVQTFQTNNELDLHFDLQKVSLNINQAIPFSLIINEVVTNVFKHAFDEQKKGTISVLLKEQENIISIRIIDNGKGLPPDFTKFEPNNSLGMQLIETLSTQLAADYSYRTVEGKTQFTLTFEKTNVKGTGNSLLS